MSEEQQRRQQAASRQFNSASENAYPEINEANIINIDRPRENFTNRELYGLFDRPLVNNQFAQSEELDRLPTYEEATRDSMVRADNLSTCQPQVTDPLVMALMRGYSVAGSINGVLPPVQNNRATEFHCSAPVLTDAPPIEEFPRDIENEVPITRNPLKKHYPRFNVIGDIKIIHKCFKLMVFDFKALANLLLFRSMSQRIKIAETYKEIYKKDLKKRLASSLPDNIKHFFITLLLPYDKIEAYWLKVATKKQKPNQELINAILSCNSKYELKKISTAFKEFSKDTLPTALSSVSQGPYQKLLVYIFTSEYQSDISLDTDNIMHDIQQIVSYDRTDPLTYYPIFQRVIMRSSYVRLKQLIEVYYQEYNANLSDIFSKLSLGDFADLLTKRTLYTANPAYYNCLLVRNALKNKNIPLLLHIMVTRSEMDLKEIINQYEYRYSCSFKIHLTDLAAKPFGNLLSEFLKETAPN